MVALLVAKPIFNSLLVWYKNLFGRKLILKNMINANKNTTNVTPLILYLNEAC